MTRVSLKLAFSSNSPSSAFNRRNVRFPTIDPDGGQLVHYPDFRLLNGMVRENEGPAQKLKIARRNSDGMPATPRHHSPAQTIVGFLVDGDPRGRSRDGCYYSFRTGT